MNDLYAKVKYGQNSYPSVNNYNGRLLLNLCLLIQCWKVSAEFSRNQIWHTQSIIRRALLFLSRPDHAAEDHAAEEGHVGVLVQLFFFFSKNFF